MKRGNQSTEPRGGKGAPNCRTIRGKDERDTERTIEKLLHGRSVIVIAHRLSTVRRADKIIVLSKGQIAEMGSHDELMAKGGQYAELYTMGFEEEDPKASE